MAFMNTMNNLPPGVLFTPTSEQLLLHFLPGRQKGERFDPFIKDVQLFGDKKEPWTLFDSDENSCFYVFTDLNKKGKRVQRRAGSGTWIGQSNNPVKDRHGNVIGFDRYFNYKNKGAIDDEHGQWTMHEFARVDERGHPVDDKVVCIIGHDTHISTKRHTKRRRIMASPPTDEEIVRMETSFPSSGSVVSEGAQVEPASEEIDALLRFDLSDAIEYILEGPPTTSRTPISISTSTTFPSSALVVSEEAQVEPVTETEALLPFGLSDATQNTLEATPSTHTPIHTEHLGEHPSLIVSEPYFEFEEGDVWLCCD